MAPLDADQDPTAGAVFPKLGPRAVVLCDGPAPPDGLLRRWLAGADLFVCADGAGHPYEHLPRTPDVVIGDFDSLAGRVLDGRGGPRFLQVVDHYTTDSEKALLFVEDQGFQEAVLLGATGRRLDHTLYNCNLLERFADRLRVCLSGPWADTVRVGPGAHMSWDLPVGSGFSLMPLFGPVTQVTLEGGVYPLLGETLAPGGPATISNLVAMSPLLLSVGQGSLLVSFDRGSDHDSLDDEEFPEDHPEDE